MAGRNIGKHHSSLLCGPDPAYFATLIDGAKKHGEANFTLDAPIHYTVVDQSNPIVKDMSAPKCASREVIRSPCRT